jgi:hypothetical protein
MPATRPANKPARKPARKPAPMSYLKYRSDGTLWAKGQTLNGKMTRLWTWFRKEGSPMGSGSFEKGEQTGT